MSKEPKDLGKKLDEGNFDCGILDICSRYEGIISEEMRKIYCHSQEQRDCFYRAKRLYESLFPKQVIIPMQKFQNLF